MIHKKHDHSLRTLLLTQREYFHWKQAQLVNNEQPPHAYRPVLRWPRTRPTQTTTGMTHDISSWPMGSITTRPGLVSWLDGHMGKGVQW